MVKVFDTKDICVPCGNPVNVPKPVTPVVVCVIAGNAVLMHPDGVDDAVVTVLLGFTVIVPVAFTFPQPPISGML